MYACVRACMHLCMYVCMSGCMYVCVSVYYVCLLVCTQTRMRVCRFFPYVCNLHVHANVQNVPYPHICMCSLAALVHTGAHQRCRGELRVPERGELSRYDVVLTPAHSRRGGCEITLLGVGGWGSAEREAVRQLRRAEQSTSNSRDLLPP